MSCKFNFFFYKIFYLILLMFFQSQPCHWRNLKGVTKRDVSNQTIPIEDETEKKENNLSDNVSLFQSLRVLQEGEGEDDLNEEALSKLLKLF